MLRLMACLMATLPRATITFGRCLPNVSIRYGSHCLMADIASGYLAGWSVQPKLGGEQQMLLVIVNSFLLIPSLSNILFNNAPDGPENGFLVSCSTLYGESPNSSIPLDPLPSASSLLTPCSLLIQFPQ